MRVVFTLAWPQIFFYRGGAFLVFAQVLFKGLQLVHEIILRIIVLGLLYDMGVFFTRHTCLFSSFALPGRSHAVLAVFFDYSTPPHGVALHVEGVLICISSTLSQRSLTDNNSGSFCSFPRWCNRYQSRSG